MPQLFGDVNKAPLKRGRPATVRPLVIQYVQENPGCTIKKIARALGRHDAYVSSVLVKLRKTDQVERNEKGGYSWVGSDDLLDASVAEKLKAEIEKQQQKKELKESQATSFVVEDEYNHNDESETSSASEVAEEVDDEFESSESNEEDETYLSNDEDEDPYVEIEPESAVDEVDEYEEDVIDLSSQIEDDEDDSFASSYEHQ